MDLGYRNTVFFFSHNDQIVLWDELAQNLRTLYKYHTVLLVLGKSDEDWGNKYDGYSEVIDVLPDMVHKQITFYDEDYRNKIAYLNELEERVGCKFVQEDISMDRYFRGQTTSEVDLKDYAESWNHERAVYFMASLAGKLEDLYKKYQPCLAYQETNSAPYRMSWRIAQLYNCKSGYLMIARGWEDRIYFEDSLCLEWNRFGEVYQNLNLDQLGPEFLERVNARYDQIVSSQELPKTYYGFSKKPDSLVQRLKPSRVLKNLKERKHFTNDNWLDNPRSVSQSVFSYQQKFKRYLRRKASYKYYMQNCQTNFDVLQPYAIYFLHVQPEITVEESAFEYMDQVATIRNIAASLPAGVPLLIKEHRPSAGRRPIEFYAELTHIPNVVMINESMHSHTLIKNALVVVTLTGTVAIEAIYYSTPVIVLGSIYFNECNGVYHPVSVPEMRSLLNSLYNLKGATREDALKFLAASYIASTYGKTFGLGISDSGSVDAAEKSYEHLHLIICKVCNATSCDPN